MKKIALFICIISLSGCSTNNQNKLFPSGVSDIEFLSIWSHPAYGIVDDKNRKLNEDRDTCREKAYQAAVNVNGELITDPKRLNAIESDLKMKYVSQQLKKHKTMPTESAVLSDAVDFVKNAPPYLSEIRAKQREFIHCFRIEKQYTLIKTESYSKKTGELISSTEHKQ